MKKTKLKHKIIIMAFAICMVIGLLPFSAFANAGEVGPTFDTGSRRIFANGFPLTIQNGTNPNETQISYIDSTGSPKYLTLVAATPTSDVAIDIDVDSYTIFGGGNGKDCTNSSITVNGGNVKTIYGGGYNASVTNSTTIQLNGGNIGRDEYGGTVYVFGGGYADNGNTHIISGDININLNGTKIGNNNDVYNSTVGTIFGGGHSIASNSSVEVGNTTLTLTKGEI